MKQLAKYCLTAILFLYCITSSGKDRIVLSQNQETASVDHAIQILIDSGEDMGINEAINAKARFTKYYSHEINCGYIENALWIKLPIENTSNKKWLIKISNPIISYLDVFYVLKDTIIRKKSGNVEPYENRDIKNNNFLFFLPQDQDYTIYIRAQSVESLIVPVTIGTVEYFFEENHFKDLIEGIYFGFVLIIIIYNLFIYFKTKERLYVYCVLYTLALSLIVFHFKGLSFDFIYPNYEWLNKKPSIMYTLCCVTGIVFCISFLDVKTYLKRTYQVLIFTIITGFSTVVLLSILGHEPKANILIQFMAILFPAVLYILSILVYFKGFRPAKYFVIAWTFFLIAIAIAVLYNFKLVPKNYLTNNAIQIGSALEILLLSLALGDKIKRLKEEKAEAKRIALQLLTEKQQAQADTILQLQEKEKLKDKINTELEKKVADRTEELMTKNKELDTFIFKASNEIKGPLKSITGLLSVGLTEVQSPISKNYFEHILKSASKLDSTLSELLLIKKVKEMLPIATGVKLESFIKEKLALPEFSEELKGLKVTLQFSGSDEFYTDERFLKIIVKQLIKNSIRYKDPQKPCSTLDISVQHKNSSVLIAFKDNGFGIDPSMKDKIFDMHFSTNAVSGTELGLFLIKMCIEKLNGKITVETSPGTGSKFTLEIPQFDYNNYLPRK